VLINGLPLPRDLLDLVAAGRWRQPTDMSGIDALFADHGGFYPYGFDCMRSETEGLLPRREVMWLGAPDSYNPPGDIDMTKAVLIADIGIGWDQPVALDYRLSLQQPRVLTLRWLTCDYVSPTGEVGGYNGEGNRWVVLAPDFKTFAELAKL
jgi:hypothetical protein